MSRIAAMLTAAAVATSLLACSSEGDGGTGAGPTPTIALTLGSAAVTVAQGASAPISVTLTRGGGFTGTVTLTVTGSPTGVTATVGPITTAGSTSTATVTIAVAGSSVPGTFPLVIQATGSGVATATAAFSLTVTAAPDFTLSVTPASASVVQGGTTAAIPIAIARTNFSEAVTLSLSGTVPAGVTAVFAPPTPTGTISTMTISVGPAVAPGTYPLTVQGTGSIGTRSTPLALTVTAAGSFVLAVTPGGGVTLVQGTSDASRTIAITRTNFAAAITLSASNLPNGLTANFAPNPNLTGSAILTLTAAPGAALGAHTITIQGAGEGAGALRAPGPSAAIESATTLVVTITAPPTGNVSVSFAACPSAEKPVWLVFMDGVSSPWTAVAGVADVYQFNLTQSKGSVAYVTQGPSFSHITVLHRTLAEWTADPISHCATPPTVPQTRIVNGTVAGVGPTATSRISFGNNSALIVGSNPFQLTETALGVSDLVGYSHADIVAGGVSDRVFLKRNENPADGGSFSVPVDFFGAFSAPPAWAPATLMGLTGTESQIFHRVNLFTGGSACTPANLVSQSLSGPNFNLYGVPTSLTNPASDIHGIEFTVNNGATSARFLTETFFGVVSRASVPFVLPAQLPVPMVSNAGGPYKRLSVTMTGVPTEYNIGHQLSYGNLTTVGTTGTVSATQGWVGGSAVTLVLPDFSAAAGFNSTWAPAPTDALIWSVLSNGGGQFALLGTQPPAAATAERCASGLRLVTATRSGSGAF